MPASKVTESATPSLPAEDLKAIFRGHHRTTLITSRYGRCAGGTDRDVGSKQSPLLWLPVPSRALAYIESLVVCSLDSQDIEVGRPGVTGSVEYYIQAPT